mmetsp:Transcript_8261/g.24967  ORF Transcript_8261/g.24967 Transcript_8261/m.24967 type:complete len:201 (-) Transcript_8261:1192-1794(-)
MERAAAAARDSRCRAACALSAKIPARLCSRCCCGGEAAADAVPLRCYRCHCCYRYCCCCRCSLWGVAQRRRRTQRRTMQASRGLPGSFCTSSSRVSCLSGTSFGERPVPGPPTGAATLTWRTAKGPAPSGSTSQAAGTTLETTSSLLLRPRTPSTRSGSAGSCLRIHIARRGIGILWFRMCAGAPSGSSRRTTRLQTSLA